MATRVGTYSEDDLILNNGGDYRIGDLAGAGNETKLTINDPSMLADFSTAAGRMLLLDQATGVYSIGDVDGIGGGILMELTDSGGVASIQTINGGMLALNESGQFYRMGDLSSFQNGNFLEVDDDASLFKLNNTANDIAVEMNGVAGFTGTVTPVTSITVDGGIVTNVT